MRGRADLRPLVRERIERWGARIAGAPAPAARLADDKAAARRRLREAGVPGPRWVTIRDARRPEADLDGLRFPVVAKRPLDHGSRGVTFVRRPDDLSAAVRSLSGGRGLAGRQAILLEEHVEGPEIAASIIEAGGRPRLLPLVEVVLGRSAIYGAGSKWGRDALPIRPARLPAATDRRVRRAALRAFRALGLRDYGRVDLRIDPSGIPRVLEVNARPSVEPGTEFILAGRLAGLGIEDLLSLILFSAARRHGVTEMIEEVGGEGLP